MEHSKTGRILNKILIIFLAIQPLFDIYMGIVGERLDLFGISIVTLLRTGVTIAMFATILIYQIKNKFKMKYMYVVIGYLLLAGLYMLVHHLNIVNSNGYYMTQNIYSWFTEMMYVLRLILPVLIIYIVILIKPKKESVEKVIVIAASIISVVILLTNVLEVSYASYSSENGMISYNFIDWFKMDDLSYRETLSKGFFVSANQIGALLVILLPTVMYYTLKENKPYMYLVLLVQIVSMVLIGTRVASYGWILVAAALIIVYTILISMNLHKKLRILSVFTIILIFEVGILLYVHSPAKNKDTDATYDTMYTTEIEEKKGRGEYVSLEEFLLMLEDENKLQKYVGKNYNENTLKYDAICKYVKENHRYNYITEKYVKQIYPYTEDPEFWLGMFSEPVAVKRDSRNRQLAIVKRIKDKNQNMVGDTLLGIGATPMNDREFMIENDLISHYYNLGIVGLIIFMSPYLLCILYALWQTRRSLKKLLDIRLAAYLLAICMAYFIGYFAGHVLDEYVITIYLATIAGIVFNFYKEGSESLDKNTKT